MVLTTMIIPKYPQAVSVGTSHAVPEQYIVKQIEYGPPEERLI